jgi:hypothetical protein
VFVTDEDGVRAAFTFRDRNNSVRKVGDAKEFANSLEQADANFGLIRSVANAAKHLSLTDRRPVTGAANTYVQSTGYGEGAYGVGPYGGGPRVVLEGPDGNLEFAEIARNVFQMWETLNRQHGWWAEGGSRH